jgi:hypothetical protein
MGRRLARLEGDWKEIEIGRRLKEIGRDGWLVGWLVVLLFFFVRKIESQRRTKTNKDTDNSSCHGRTPKIPD